MRPKPPDIAVTLVHGTFARKARWVSPKSNFRRLLRDSLTDRTVDIEAFHWSGRNSPKSRLMRR